MQREQVFLTYFPWFWTKSQHIAYEQQPNHPCKSNPTQLQCLIRKKHSATKLTNPTILLINFGQIHFNFRWRASFHINLKRALREGGVPAGLRRWISIMTGDIRDLKLIIMWTCDLCVIWWMPRFGKLPCEPVTFRVSRTVVASSLSSSPLEQWFGPFSKSRQDVSPLLAISYNQGRGMPKKKGGWLESNWRSLNKKKPRNLIEENPKCELVVGLI